MKKKRHKRYAERIQRNHNRVLICMFSFANKTLESNTKCGKFTELGPEMQTEAGAPQFHVM